jgi:hypothetical protein
MLRQFVGVDVLVGEGGAQVIALEHDCESWHWLRKQ